MFCRILPESNTFILFLYHYLKLSDLTGYYILAILFVHWKRMKSQLSTRNKLSLSPDYTPPQSLVLAELSRHHPYCSHLILFFESHGPWCVLQSGKRINSLHPIATTSGLADGIFHDVPWPWRHWRLCLKAIWSIHLAFLGLQGHLHE